MFDKFGFTVNEKGYKVLPPQVRVIQGDGIEYASIIKIYEALVQHNISAENLVLGMGGALLQKVNRDTQKFALKCSYAEVNGNAVNVSKSPVELNENGEMVPSFKVSKAGRLKLIREANGYATVGENTQPEKHDELVTVFENGEIKKEYTFEQVRERAATLKLVNA